jgi:hypothetical protein
MIVCVTAQFQALSRHISTPLLTPLCPLPAGSGRLSGRTLLDRRGAEIEARKSICEAQRCVHALELGEQ